MDRPLHVVRFAPINAPVHSKDGITFPIIREPGVLVFPVADRDLPFDTYVDLTGLTSGRVPYSPNSDGREIVSFDHAWLSRANQLVIASFYGKDKDPRETCEFTPSRSLAGVCLVEDHIRDLGEMVGVFGERMRFGRITKQVWVPAFGSNYFHRYKTIIPLYRE